MLRKNDVYHRSGGGPNKIDWYSRGYLPHVSAMGVCQFITFRLYDSLPREAIERWKAELARNPDKSEREFLLRKGIFEFEDSGAGKCFLRDAGCAAIVENQLKFYDQKLYRLLAWCVMPNHLHVLIQPLTEELIGGIVKRWKTYTTRECNRRLGRSGEFWMREYYDRFIRDEEHYFKALNYIERNPVMAGLAETAEEWAFGSARLRGEE